MPENIIEVIQESLRRLESDYVCEGDLTDYQIAMQLIEGYDSRLDRIYNMAMKALGMVRTYDEKREKLIDLGNDAVTLISLLELVKK